MVAFIPNNCFLPKASPTIILFLYHVNPPTQIIKTEKAVDVAPQIAEEKMLKHRSFEGFNIKPQKDYLESRKPVLVNNDVHIVLAAPQQSVTDYFYKNADADELIFVHEGSGVLKTAYGESAFWLRRLSGDAARYHLPDAF